MSSQYVGTINSSDDLDLLRPWMYDDDMELRCRVVSGPDDWRAAYKYREEERDGILHVWAEKITPVVHGEYASIREALQAAENLDPADDYPWPEYDESDEIDERPVIYHSESEKDELRPWCIKEALEETGYDVWIEILEDLDGYDYSDSPVRIDIEHGLSGDESEIIIIRDGELDDAYYAATPDEYEQYVQRYDASDILGTVNGAPRGLGFDWALDIVDELTYEECGGNGEDAVIVRVIYRGGSRYNELMHVPVLYERVIEPPTK